MRAPYQVLVIPFRLRIAEPEFAVLKRSDAAYWQFVAGGGEKGETILEAAQREVREEIGITGRFVQLDSHATVPRDCFVEAHRWRSDVYVIPEYSFAVDAGDAEIILSNEHTAVQWVSYPHARALLRWDSNRTALWEVHERLKSGKLYPESAS